MTTRLYVLRIDLKVEQPEKNIKGTASDNDPRTDKCYLFGKQMGVKMRIQVNLVLPGACAACDFL